MRNALEDHLKQSGSHHVNNALFRRNLNINGNSKANNKLITTSPAVTSAAVTSTVMSAKCANGISSNQNSHNQAPSQSISSITSVVGNKANSLNPISTATNQNPPVKSNWWRSNAS